MAKNNVLYRIADKPALEYFQKYTGNYDLFLNYCLAVYEKDRDNFFRAHGQRVMINRQSQFEYGATVASKLNIANIGGGIDRATGLCYILRNQLQAKALWSMAPSAFLY